MPLNWDLATIVAVLIVGFTLHTHWQALPRAWPAWTLALTDARRAFVEWVRVHTRVHLESLAGAVYVARDDHAHGHTAEAVRVIGVADRMAAWHVRLLRGWLQRWADLTRTQAVPAPAPPPRMSPSPRLPLLRPLAVLERLGTLLPTRELRFRASVCWQREALKWVGRHAGAAALRARRPGGLDQALDAFEATHADLVALDEQALATLERLLRVLPTHPDEDGGHGRNGTGTGQPSAS